MINNVSIDFIDQVEIQTSNFSADKGRNSGASINVVTKSGTNRFGGSLFESFRDDRLDAANYFAPRDANGNRIKAKLRLQQLRRRRSAVRSSRQAVLLHRHGVPNDRPPGIRRSARCRRAPS